MSLINLERMTRETKCVLCQTIHITKERQCPICEGQLVIVVKSVMTGQEIRPEPIPIPLWQPVDE